IEELYKRLLPALRSKLKDFKKNNINSITEDNIWIYLSETKWKTSTNLLLSDMVSDILNSDIKKIDNYFMADEEII
ncbi:MAG: post-transcriptional regulator, partial [Bacilli bacterium]